MNRLLCFLCCCVAAYAVTLFWNPFATEATKSSEIASLEDQRAADRQADRRAADLRASQRQADQRSADRRYDEQKADERASDKKAAQRNVWR